LKAIDLIKMSLEENRDYVARAIEGLSKDELAWKPKPHSNSIAFLLWHLARVEDFWINRALLGGTELYEAAGWHRKFGTAPRDSGFGYDRAALDAWPVPALELLRGYAATVREKTLVYLDSLTAARLDEAKDFGWRKGTTGSALAHLISEVGEHSGQIGYLRGAIRGLEPQPPPPPR
jgi:uncharacterized damage-inducible protein DinB